MAIKRELVQFIMQNSTQCGWDIPLFQQNVYSINATTKYAWNVTTADLSCGTGTIVINSVTYNLTYTASSLTSLIASLNALNFGFFCSETISGQTYIYTVDDTNVYGALDLCATGTTTTTTTSTSTTSSTTTAAPTTTTSTTTSTTTLAGSTTTTTSTTSTTTEAPTTTTTSTSTTSTSTTLAPTCLCYTLTNNTGNVQTFEYTPCGGSITTQALGNGGTVQRCSQTVPSNLNGIVATPCVNTTICTGDGDCTGCFGNTTTTTTSTTTSTTTEAPTTTTSTTSTSTTEAPTTTTTSTSTSTTTEAPTTTTSTTTSTTTLSGCVESVSFDVTSAGDVSITNCCGVASLNTYSVGSYTESADCYLVNGVVAVDAVITNVVYTLPSCICNTTTTSTTTTTTTGQQLNILLDPTLLGVCTGTPFNNVYIPQGATFTTGTIVYYDAGCTSPIDNTNTYFYVVRNQTGTQTSFDWDGTTGTIGTAVGTCTL